MSFVDPWEKAKALGLVPGGSPTSALPKAKAKRAAKVPNPKPVRTSKAKARKPPTDMGLIMNRAIELGADPKSFLANGPNGKTMRARCWLGAEAIEQAVVAAVLRSKGALFQGSAGGLGTTGAQAAAMAATGAGRGVPDLLVFGTYDLRGVAIEMKAPSRQRKSPAAKRGTSAEQDRWLDELGARGWVTAVCYTAEQAIDVLRKAGHIGGPR